jgi:hypothetical protein
MRHTRMHECMHYVCMRMQRAHTYWARPRTHTVRYLNTAPRETNIGTVSYGIFFLKANIGIDILLYETHTPCSLHAAAHT